MAVSATSSLDGTSALAAAAGTNAASGAGSEQRFLKLLVTQLNNQDPLNPLDNAELTSQLAQMSTVSGVEKMNTTLQSLVDQSGSSQVLQAASLIGHTVLAPSNTLALGSEGATPFGIDMQGSAKSVKVTITDAAGNDVRTYDLGELPMGAKNMSWDGKNDNGEQMAQGAYKVSVVAMDGDQRVSANTLGFAQVVSVAQNSTGILLDLGKAGSTSLNNVKVIQ